MDTAVTKVEAASSPVGPGGQYYLACGRRVSMRLWREEPGRYDHPFYRREYETVGYVIEGRALLYVGEHVIELRAGDSWLVRAGEERTYVVLEKLIAVEATSPPARVQSRDARTWEGATER